MSQRINKRKGPTTVDVHAQRKKVCKGRHLDTDTKSTDVCTHYSSLLPMYTVCFCELTEPGWIYISFCKSLQDDLLRCPIE